MKKKKQVNRRDQIVDENILSQTMSNKNKQYIVIAGRSYTKAEADQINASLQNIKVIYISI